MALNSFPTPPNQGKVIKRADPSTIQGKFLVGYQGWFTCPGDGEPVGPGHHGWLHWFPTPPDHGGRPNVDIWPDVSEYDQSELYPVPGYKDKAGEQLHLFSSRNPRTVQRHFNWMAQHGVDGAFLQRFVSEVDLENGKQGILRIRDEIGDRVRDAAEKEGRVWAIMYDVSGVPPERLQGLIVRDWMHLIRDKGVLNSHNYLREGGRPVLALWGFGFDEAGHNPNLVASIASALRSFTPGGLYLFAGVAAHWRTSSHDADTNPEFLSRAWLREFDAISPWTVGRFKDEVEAKDFASSKFKGDMELIKKHNEEIERGGPNAGRKIDYVPVVFPGSSGYNLSQGKWGFNDAKRNGGRFLWQQIYNAKHHGARIIYGAMWDEYDEGTAFMPVVHSKRKLPVSDTYQFMALDEDKFDLTPDWYMRICGFGAELLRGERELSEVLPSKDLHDYWSKRPRYEYISVDQYPGPSGSNYGGPSNPAHEAPTGPAPVQGELRAEGHQNQSYQEWLVQQQRLNLSGKDELPPPPYSLEADDPVTQSGNAHATTPAPAGQPQQPHIPNPSQGTNQVPSSPSLVTSGSSAGPVGGPANVGTTGLPPRPSQGYGYSPNSPTIGVPYPTVPNFGAPQNYDSARYGSASPHTQSYPPQQSPYGPTDPAVAALANEFGKQKISDRPPLHPSHPAAGSNGYGLGKVSSLGGGRPPSAGGPAYPGVGYPGYKTSPPVSQPHSPTPGPGPAYHSLPAGPQQSGGYWSQSQWPPADWQTNTGGTSSQGANLSRPHTFTASGASSQHDGADLHPHATISGRPTNHTPHTDGPANSGFPQANWGGPGSATFPPPGSGAPSFHVLPSASQYPGYPPTTGPGIGYPPYQQYGGGSYGTVAPPHGPGPASGLYPHPGSKPTLPPLSPQLSPQPGSTNPTSSPVLGPHSSAPLITNPSPSNGTPGLPGSGYNDQDPYSKLPPGPGGYYSNQSGSSGYPSGPHSNYGEPYPSAGPSSGSSFPSSFVGLNLPPRPTNTGYGPTPGAPVVGGSSSSGRLSFPVATGAAGNALNYAFNTIEGIAGKKTRTQLESQMGNLAQSGNKLWSKFNK